MSLVDGLHDVLETCPGQCLVLTGMPVPVGWPLGVGSMGDDDAATDASLCNELPPR